MKTLTNLVTLGSFALVSLSGAQEIRTTVNDRYVFFPDVEPMMVGGRVMVPLRGVFEEMGVQVHWDQFAQTVHAKGSGTELSLPVGSHTATVNNELFRLDAPARIHRGRTLVPLRFMAEALNAIVNWVPAERTVQIYTTVAGTAPLGSSRVTPVETIIPTQAVLPFRLETRLSSATSMEGDRFVATIDAQSSASALRGLPVGTQIEGRVDTARPRMGGTPGVLGLTFERVRLPNGGAYPIGASLIGLDDKSVANENGMLVARANARNNNMKYVGYGAGAGVLLSILGKGDLLTNALIGGALGYLAAEIERDRTKARDVTLEAGSRIGVRLTEQFTFHMPK